jgi:hypothetical protein
MRDSQLETCLAMLPCVAIGGIISTRRTVSLCSLSSVLERGEIPEEYFLSPLACAGILRRAAKRGRSLPPSLRQALEAAAQMTTPPGVDTSLTPEDETALETELDLAEMEEEPWAPSVAPLPAEDGG